MPAAYSDGLSNFEQISDGGIYNRPLKSLPVGLHPQRSAVFTIPEHDYRNLVDSLAPSQADLTISTQPDFNPSTFYLNYLADISDISKFEREFYEDLFGESSLYSIGSANPWASKYGKFIPSSWVFDPESIGATMENIEIRFAEANGLLRIHPYIINALIEYPDLQFGLRIANLLPLNYAQLAVLTKNNIDSEILYTQIYPKQFRRGGIQTIREGFREFEQIIRSKDDQMVNRLIFEMLPPRYRKIFRK